MLIGVSQLDESSAIITSLPENVAQLIFEHRLMARFLLSIAFLSDFKVHVAYVVKCFQSSNALLISRVIR